MKNLYRIYQTTLCTARLFLADVLMLIELWEKLQHLFPSGVVH